MHLHGGSQRGGERLRLKRQRLPLPARSIPDRLANQHYYFEEADALLDLWCHTVWQEPRNIFSHMAPTVQFGSLDAVLTLEILGHRLGLGTDKGMEVFQKT